MAGILHVSIVAVGKLKEPYAAAGVAEYVKRLRPYVRLQMTEVDDEPAPDPADAAATERALRREAERLLARLPHDAYVIALAVDGELWSSEELAGRLQRLAAEGRGRVAFVVGGTCGLHADVLRRADARWSLGRITLPHQLARLVLTEQLYRALKIMRGEGYHR